MKPVNKKESNLRNQAADRSLEDSTTAKASGIVDVLTETTYFDGHGRSTWNDKRNLGKWWGPEPSKEDYEAQLTKREALSAEKSKMQNVANKVRGMEPNSRALLDLVIGRDSLLKEKQARQQLEAELAKHGLTVDDVEDYMFKERGSGDVRIPQIMGGAEVGTGDLIGVKARGGQPFYFSRPMGGLPDFTR